MIRKNIKVINYLQVIADVIILSISFLISSNIPGVRINNKYNISIIYLLSIGVYILLYLYVDLYKSRRNSHFIHEFNDIIKANLIAYVLISIIYYVFNALQELDTSILFFFLTNNMVIVLYKYVIRVFLRDLRKKGYNKKYILILGVNSLTNDFVEKINEDKNLGYEIVGFFEDTNKVHQLSSDLKHMGNFGDFNNYIRNNIIDEVIVTIDDDETDKIKQSVEMCEIWGVKFTIIPNIFSLLPTRSYLDNFDGIPVINVRKIPLDNVGNLIAKRIFDVIISILSLIIFLPVMLITAIVIKLTSEGPIIFKQKRVGLNRREFYMYKFRSMKTETEKIRKFTDKSDNRVTSVGKFIRKYSIDELPQIINVLKGDMSLIGPRPEIPFFVENFRSRVPHYMLKHYIKPGMSGLAQVNGFRGNTSIEERIRYDIHYIENWSLLLDVKILLKTVIVGIFNKNAY